jgi:hypothetical protein
MRRWRHFSFVWLVLFLLVAAAKAIAVDCGCDPKKNETKTEVPAETVET